MARRAARRLRLRDASVHGAVPAADARDAHALSLGDQMTSPVGTTFLVVALSLTTHTTNILSFCFSMSGAMIESLEIYVHIMQKTELKLETNLCLEFPIFIGKFFRRAMV